MSFGCNRDAASINRDTGILKRLSELVGRAAEKMIAFGQEKSSNFESKNLWQPCKNKGSSRYPEKLSLVLQQFYKIWSHWNSLVNKHYFSLCRWSRFCRNFDTVAQQSPIVELSWNYGISCLSHRPQRPLRFRCDDNQLSPGLADPDQSRVPAQQRVGEFRRPHRSSHSTRTRSTRSQSTWSFSTPNVPRESRKSHRGVGQPRCGQ